MSETRGIYNICDVTAILSYFMLFYTILSYLSIFIPICAYNCFRGEMMRPLKDKISITIDNDVLELLKGLAEEDDRSLSQFINLVLKDYLKKNGKI